MYIQKHIYIHIYTVFKTFIIYKYKAVCDKQSWGFLHFFHLDAVLTQSQQMSLFWLCEMLQSSVSFLKQLCQSGSLLPEASVSPSLLCMFDPFIHPNLFVSYLWFTVSICTPARSWPDGKENEDLSLQLSLIILCASEKGSNKTNIRPACVAVLHMFCVQLELC